MIGLSESVYSWLSEWSILHIIFWLPGGFLQPTRYFYEILMYPMMQALRISNSRLCSSKRWSGFVEDVFEELLLFTLFSFARTLLVLASVFLDFYFYLFDSFTCCNNLNKNHLLHWQCYLKLDEEFLSFVMSFWLCRLHVLSWRCNWPEWSSIRLHPRVPTLA